MTLEMKIDGAIGNYWKLKALEMPSGEETDKVISVLIDNQEIRSILKEMASSPQDTSEASKNR